MSTALPALPRAATLADQVSSLSGVVPSYSTIPRVLLAGSGSPLTSQTLLAVYNPIPGGQPINNLGFLTGGTAAVTPLNWWMLIMDASRKVLAVTADQGSAAIGTFAKISLPLPSTLITPGVPSALTFLYTCIMVNAATPPSFESISTSGLMTGAPAVLGNSTGALTTPPAVGATMAVITSGPVNTPYLFAD